MQTTRKVYLFMGLMTLFVYFSKPEILLDIPISYILKNYLRQTPPQISLFRFLLGIPIYGGALIGLIRDEWKPFGSRDLGRSYFRISAVVATGAFAYLVWSGLSIISLFAGMFIAIVSSQFIVASLSGSMAAIGQTTRGTGRLSTLWVLASWAPIICALFFSGYIVQNLSPKHTFALALLLTLPLLWFGFWKKSSYVLADRDGNSSGTSNVVADLKRLLRSPAVYPAFFLNFLGSFAPGINTPMQFFLANQLGGGSSRE